MNSYHCDLRSIQPGRLSAIAPSAKELVTKAGLYEAKFNPYWKKAKRQLGFSKVKQPKVLQEFLA